MKRLVVGLLMSIGLFVAVSTCSFIYLFGGDESRDTVTVPNFEGKMISEIKDDPRFQLENEGEFSDRAEGEIIGQIPPSGAKRKLAKGEKCKVRLKVSLGEKREILPNLAGFHYIEAANVLRELGISVRIVSVYDEDSGRDSVIRSSPEFGQAVKRGDKVTLFVARDHIKGSVRVGNYTGLEKEEAVSRLLADGLTVSEILVEYSDEYPAGSVIAQSIKSGASVPYGSEISLTVCGGEDKGASRFRFRWGMKS